MKRLKSTISIYLQKMGWIHFN